MIIGITGTDGSGKGEVVEYLKTKGFKHYSGRALITEEIKKRKLPVDREHMRIVANSLRAEHGNDYIAREYIRRANEENIKNVVIESVREIAAAEFLKRKGGILISVDADPELRYERIQKRASSSDKVTFEEFKKHEELEMNDPDPNGMQKAAVMKMADFHLENNGTILEFHKKIEAMLSEIRG